MDRCRVDDIDSRAPPSPGRVTVRRLNRNEYQNTIRDLLGIEFNAAAEFPADDVGYGFDNIGDVLSLPPMLMEKYLAAAEEIAGRAIVTDPIQAAPRTQVDGGRLRTGTGAASPRDGVATLSSQGELYLDHEFPRDGKYILRTRAAADQAGDEPARMRLSLDGQSLNEFDVKAHRDQPQDYDWQQQVSPGKHRVALAFTNDFYDPAAADPDRRDRNLHVVDLQIIGPVEIGPEAYPASHRKILFVQPGPGVSPGGDSPHPGTTGVASLPAHR